MKININLTKQNRAIDNIETIKRIDYLVRALNLEEVKKALVNRVGYLSQQDLMFINNSCILQDINMLISNSSCDIKTAIDIVRNDKVKLGYRY